MSAVNVFVAELVGTFGLVMAATGSIVLDGRADFSLGPAFVALAHFAGLAVMVAVFGRYSMAHFNPAVTLGFAMAGHLGIKRIPLYIAAQAIGAVSASLFVKYALGNHAKLGLSIPNPDYPLGIVFGAETLATVLLMGVILAVARRGPSAWIAGAAIGGVVALDVLFFGPVSGASMNPIRSLAPALVTGIFDGLWLYWTSTFIGTVAVGMICRRLFPGRIIRRI